ncbi:conserved hypothetical protein [Culex quinquefasciatus]|uniref:Peptidase A1 domain-containing protein n=1 Tax=Culex quinquefasciatus TaxID=7176 RepID=B0XJV0_CULQU|nr:uncharacterized protein K02A2.6 [Culex quinquefasciatus]EDS30795.1 conserved hypothetical protein [Culex quinquefasciatus]|eukprot:XP_001869922.1 conserved hypothetical protein [Culex quinquefasciatus]
MPGMFGMLRNRCSLRSPPECQHPLTGGSRRCDWVDAGKGAETAIYGVPLDLQLDSGSGITIISRQNWVNVGSPPTSPPDCNVQTASGDKLGIEAMFRATYTIGGTHKESNCYVCSADLSLNVLGSDLMDEFGLWDVPFSSFCKLVGTQTPNQQVVELKAKFLEVFNDSLGLCPKTCASFSSQMS